MLFSHFLTSNRCEKFDKLSDLHIDLKRFKTDTEDLQKQINLVNQLESNNITI